VPTIPVVHARFPFAILRKDKDSSRFPLFSRPPGERQEIGQCWPFSSEFWVCGGFESRTSTSNAGLYPGGTFWTLTVISTRGTGR